MRILMGKESRALALMRLVKCDDSRLSAVWRHAVARHKGRGAAPEIIGLAFARFRRRHIQWRRRQATRQI